MERLTHLDQIADRERFTVVYPELPRRLWTQPAASTTRSPGERPVEDPAGLVSRVVRDVVGRYRADGHRVYAVGVSTGGIVVERLGCALASTFSGIASVSGAMPADAASGCRPQRRLRVLLMHGTDDPLIPFAGGPTRGKAAGVVVLPVAASEELWRRVEGCTVRPVTRQLPDTFRDGTRVSVAASAGCAQGGGVAVYTIAGGGNSWPGGNRSQPGAVTGRTSRDFDAGEAIWRFFTQPATCAVQEVTWTPAPTFRQWAAGHADRFRDPRASASTATRGHRC